MGCGGCGRRRSQRPAASAAFLRTLAAWPTGSGGDLATTLYAARGRQGCLSQFRVSHSGVEPSLREGGGVSPGECQSRTSRLHRRGRDAAISATGGKGESARLRRHGIAGQRGYAWGTVFGLATGQNSLLLI